MPAGAPEGKAGSPAPGYRYPGYLPGCRPGSGTGLRLPVKGPKPWRLLAAAPLLLLFQVALACGEGPAPASTPLPLPGPSPTPVPTPTPTPPPDPQAILSRAAARVAATESLAFVLEHQSGGARIGPGLLLTRAEGVFNRPVAAGPVAAGVDTAGGDTAVAAPAAVPGNFHITLDLETSGSFLQVSVIAVEERAFITNLFSGQWERTEREAVPFRLDNAAETFAGLISGVQSPELAGEERLALEGYTAYRIRGTLPAATLGQLVPAVLTDTADTAGPDVAVEIWADRAEIRLPRALLAGPLSPGDAAAAGRTLTLEALDPPAEITAPEIGN